jgi:hypothetical protein
MLAGVLSLSLPRLGSGQEAGPSWNEVKTYTVEKKDDAITFGKQLMREADVKIRDLERRAAKSTGEVKAAHEKNMNDLKDKRALTAAKLDAMGKASGNAWEATKNGFADAGRDLQRAYDKAAAQFR